MLEFAFFFFALAMIAALLGFIGLIGVAADLGYPYRHLGNTPQT